METSATDGKMYYTYTTHSLRVVESVESYPSLRVLVRSLTVRVPLFRYYNLLVSDIFFSIAHEERQFPTLFKAMVIFLNVG